MLTHKLISPSEASQPFYVAARLDAASQSSDPVAQTRLYEEATALDSSLRDPRLQLAEAAFARKQDALALAAFESYPATGHSAVNYISVEKLAAEAETRRRNWSAALEYYRDLLNRVTDPPQRAALMRARDAAALQQNLEVANQSRSPVVTDNVNQPVIVKPKLTSLRQNLASGEPASGGQQ